MIIVLFVLAFLTILFIVILFSKLTIKLIFTYNEQNKDLFLTIHWLKFIKVTRTISVFDFDETELDLDFVYKTNSAEREKSFNIEQLKQKRQSIKDAVNIFRQITPEIKQALKNIHLQELSWATLIGTEKADQTAILTGVLFSVKGMVSSTLINVLTNFSRPEIDVTPIFHEACYRTKLKCILSFRIGQIIRDMIKVLFKYLKMKKVNHNE